ncbi:MAG: transposase [Lysinibacillus sp.]
MYVHAIRMADCFHVNGYVTDALQHVRKQAQKDHSLFTKTDVNRQFRLFHKRNGHLSEDQKAT